MGHSGQQPAHRGQFFILMRKLALPFQLSLKSQLFADVARRGNDELPQALLEREKRYVLFLRKLEVQYRPCGDSIGLPLEPPT